MRRQVDSYSMLICSKYVKSISDMINITLVNSKFKDNIDKLHFNPFQINHNSRKYFSNLQTQWLFDINDEIFSDGDISAYYVYYELNYQKYLEMKNKYQNIKFRRIIYTKDDRLKYGKEIPFVVNKLDNNCFSETTVKQIKIPDSIVEIGSFCFDCCTSLTSITISLRLTNIGQGVFSYCSKLQSITLPSVLTSLNKSVFYRCSELTTIEYSPFVDTLDDSLFYFLNVVSTITIPSSITRIDDFCFSYCNLVSTTIPSNVIEVGKSIFRYNSKLQEVELPNNMMELSDYMFSCCNKLSKINIPSSLTKIGDNCFSACYMFTIPTTLISQLHHIGSNCFSNCGGIKEITINNEITYIGNCSSLEYIVIPQPIKKMTYRCFDYCISLTRIELPSSLTSIGDYCFKGCIKLKEINIPMGVVKIGIDAFMDSTQLELITGNDSICKKFRNRFNNTPFLQKLAEQQLI